MKLTIKDAPACLNTSDKAMWLLGYNEAIEKLNSAEPIGYVAHGRNLHPSRSLFANCSILEKIDADEYFPECITPLYLHPPVPTSAEPVYYEYRTWYGENTVKPGWGEWVRVTPRNALCTMEDAVNEIDHYIGAGYKYQLRGLYEHPPAPSVVEQLQAQLESEKLSHAAWEKQSLLEYSEVVQERDALLKAIKLALDESPVDRDILRDAIEKLKEE